MLHQSIVSCSEMIVIYEQNDALKGPMNYLTKSIIDCKLLDILGAKLDVIKGLMNCSIKCLNNTWSYLI